MAKSSAKTVAAYLAELPPERREVVAAARRAIRSKLPKGYRESMAWGMIAWEIPLERYPDTYNGKPLLYMALAAQKNNFAVYSMCANAVPEFKKWLKETFAKAGKRLDMGMSCLRFKSLDDVPAGVFERLAGQATPAQYIALFERGLPHRK